MGSEIWIKTRHLVSAGFSGSSLMITLMGCCTPVHYLRKAYIHGHLSHVRVFVFLSVLVFLICLWAVLWLLLLRPLLQLGLLNFITFANMSPTRLVVQANEASATRFCIAVTYLALRQAALADPWGAGRVGGQWRPRSWGDCRAAERAAGQRRRVLVS